MIVHFIRKHDYDASYECEERGARIYCKVFDMAQSGRLFRVVSKSYEYSYSYSSFTVTELEGPIQGKITDLKISVNLLLLNEILGLSVIVPGFHRSKGVLGDSDLPDHLHGLVFTLESIINFV